MAHPPMDAEWLFQTNLMARLERRVREQAPRWQRFHRWVTLAASPRRTGSRSLTAWDIDSPEEDCRWRRGRMARWYCKFLGQYCGVLSQVCSALCLRASSIELLQFFTSPIKYYVKLERDVYTPDLVAAFAATPSVVFCDVPFIAWHMLTNLLIFFRTVIYVRYAQVVI